LHTAVEDSGGTDVWIKPPASRKTKVATEVLATRESFDRALEAMKGVASRENLQANANFRKGVNGAREAEVRIVQGNRLIARWGIREVARLRRAAIIIDDLGADEHAAERLLALPYSLTFSVLPDLPHSAATAEEAYRGGRQVMLHLPMEPEPGAAASPGPGVIKIGMTSQEVARLVNADLSSVPHVQGVNNHMGSRATADPRLMAAVMKVLAERRMFFVDSRTTAATTALDAARHAGIPAFYRSVFLDDTETVDYSLGQLREFRRVVEERGIAIAIGHPHPTTISALAQFLPQLELDDIELVPASELVRLPETARLSPPPARLAQASHP
jgi:polysaccharide deacetylase 2 family uncharacterized protein YibQ